MRVLVAFVLLVLSACSYQQLFDKLSTPQEQAMALHAAQAVQKGDLGWLSAHAGDRLRQDLTPVLGHQMQALSPRGQPVLSAVNVQWLQNGGKPITLKRLTYEIGANDRWALLQVVLETEGPKPLVNGVFVQLVDRSPRAANRLTLTDKGFIHFLWLVLMAAAVGTCITAFVLVLRTKRLRWKWLWCVGVFLSSFAFQLNWTTGAWDFMPISVTLFGAGALQQGPMMPWVMTFAIPVVAITFLVLRALGRLPIKPAEDQSIGTP
ncbi:hypothetical protein [Sphingomonas sp. TDK1]|uniref:hypothetical protein n=1 Tax=Sphingomonas sp. TDK1 TaxID=453247 RepID=UPI0007D99E7A|nr:hypothetical protein [Sphingomonas sp. TDK1]OAN60035.1 hypothetical protein A7X12_02840 [Sphingomonas sp. TDK1]